MNPHLYLHIPKSGGTYVRNWLRKECNLVSIIPETPEKKTVRANFGNVGRPLCFLAHDFDPAKMMPIEDYGFKFTLLRNPFSMFKSFYNYYRSGKFIPHNIEALGKFTMGFNSDYALSILTNTYEEHIDAQIKKKRVFPNSHFDEKILSSLDFVGTCEMMDESMTVVARKIGVEYHPAEKANKTDPASDFEYRKDEVIGLLDKEFEIYRKYSERLKVVLFMEDLEVS